MRTANSALASPWVMRTAASSPGPSVCADWALRRAAPRRPVSCKACYAPRDCVDAVHRHAADALPSDDRSSTGTPAAAPTALSGASPAQAASTSSRTSVESGIFGTSRVWSGLPVHAAPSQPGRASPCWRGDALETAPSATLDIDEGTGGLGNAAIGSRTSACSSKPRRGGSCSGANTNAPLRAGRRQRRIRHVHLRLDTDTEIGSQTCSSIACAPRRKIQGTDGCTAGRHGAGPHRPSRRHNHCCRRRRTPR